MILRTIQSGLLTLLAAATLLAVILGVWASNDPEFNRSLRLWLGENVLGTDITDSDEYLALQADLNTSRAQRSTLQQELATARSRLRDQEQETARLQASLDQMKNHRNDARAAAEQTRQQLAAEKDRLESEFATLQQKLAAAAHAKDVDIDRLKNNLTVIRVGNRILFDTGSADLKASGREVLSLISDTLNQFPNRIVRVEGHTDDRPIISEAVRARYPSNWDLSAARAVSAVRYLEEKGAVDPRRLLAAGLGPWHPVASNEEAEGRAANRRIEIVLLPADEAVTVKQIALNSDGGSAAPSGGPQQQ